METQSANKDLTLKELAAITGIHFKSLARMALQGKLMGTYRVGRDWRFRRECLDEIRGIKKPT